MLVAVLVAGWLAACSANREARKSWNVTLASGSVGGAWSVIGEALVQMLRNAFPDSSFTMEPGQDGANAVPVERGDIQLAVLNAPLALGALQGSEPYQTKLSKIRAVTLLYSDAAFHFVIAKRTGLRSVAEVKEKHFPLRVAVNTRGSFMEVGGRAALEAHGITFEDLKRWGGAVYYFPMNTAFDMMKDHKLDAVTTAIPYPNSQVMEAAITTDLTLLPIAGQPLDSSNRRLGTESTTIPRNAYRFMDEDVSTFYNRTILITSADLPDDMIYGFTRAIHDQLGYLRKVHKVASRLTAESMPQVGGVPLHPGAARFYEERGLGVASR